MTDGVTKLYGTASPPAYVDFAFHDKIAPVNYPPLALYELGAAGWVYSLATGGRFPDTVALTVVMKILPVIFEAGLITVLFASLRGTTGEDSARRGVLSYWLNPAAIVCASVGGYLDTLPALPALGAIAAAAAGWPAARRRARGERRADETAGRARPPGRADCRVERGPWRGRGPAEAPGRGRGGWACRFRDPSRARSSAPASGRT